MLTESYPSSWRGVLTEAVERYYLSAEKAHGLQHVKDVERLCLEISKEPEYANCSIDNEVLSTAALLHDSGYSQKKDSWSQDQREHVQEGMRVAQEILSEIPAFSENPQKIEQVLYLILNHDNTNYLFPFKGRGGKPAITREWVR